MGNLGKDNLEKKGLQRDRPHCCYYLSSVFFVLFFFKSCFCTPELIVALKI